MNKGFGDGTIFVVDISHVIEKHTNVGLGVLVRLSNGNSFVCGCEQEFFIDGEFIVIDRLLGVKIGYDVYIEEIKHIGETVLYDISVTDTDHIFNILVGDLFIPVHNLPSLPGAIVPGTGGQTKDNNIYKYVPIYSTDNVIVYKDVYRHTPNKRQDIQMNVVNLGGEFEQIGETDEEVGGGNQKVGSNN